MQLIHSCHWLMLRFKITHIFQSSLFLSFLFIDQLSQFLLCTCFYVCLFCLIMLSICYGLDLNTLRI